MKRIFITGVPDIGNQGSFAMFKVLVDELDKVLGACCYTLETDNVEAAEKVMEDLNIGDVEVIPNYFHIKKSSKPVFLIKYYSKLLRFNLGLRIGRKRSALLRKLSTCDGIVNIGGDSLSHSPGQFSVIMQLDKLLLGKKLGLKTIVLAHTLGKYSKSYRGMILSKLGKIDLITVRERLSLDYMNSLGFNSIIETSDMAFLLEPSDYIMEELKLREIGKFACFVPSSMLYKKTFSDLSSLSEKHAAYLDIAKYMIDSLLERGLKVVLVPHVFVKTYRDDLEAQKIKQQLYRDDDRVIFFNRQFYAHEVKEIVKHSECVTSFRMHPTLAGISQGIPCFLIIDSHKGQGILGKLEPERFIINGWKATQGELNKKVRSFLPEFLDSLVEIRSGLNNGGIVKAREAAAMNFTLLYDLIQ